MILDSATPMLHELYVVSEEYAKDALSYASIKLSEAMKKKARSYGKSSFGQDFSSGYRRLADSKSKVSKGSYFNRFSHRDGAKEKVGMDEFVKFKVYDDSLKSVVGFIDIKGFNAKLYDNGKVIGSKHVKGQAGTKKIGEKLEYGGREELTIQQRKLFWLSGWGKSARKGYIERKARPVVNPAFASMQGEIISIFREKYGEALSKHATNFKPKRMVS